MGVIQRQGIKQSIVNYIGVIIGAVNILLIYPKMLEQEQWGFIMILGSACKLLYPFVLLGSLNMIVRFFPYFNDEENQHNGYLPFFLIWMMVGFSLFTILFFSFRDELLIAFALYFNVLQLYQL